MIALLILGVAAIVAVFYGRWLVRQPYAMGPIVLIPWALIAFATGLALLVLT